MDDRLPIGSSARESQTTDYSHSNRPPQNTFDIPGFSAQGLSDQSLERVVVSIIDEFEEAESICQRILDSGVTLLGVDAEGFGQCGVRKVSLVQLAFGNHVALIKIDRIWKSRGGIDLPKSFNHLMMSKTIIKIGVDLTNDIEQLREAYGLRSRGVIDLQDIATLHQIADVSMSGLLRKYFPDHSFDRQNRLKKINSVRSGDWDGELTSQQIEYAAIDGYLSLHLGRKMLDRSVEVVNEDIDPDQEVRHLYDWIGQWFITGEYRPINKIVNQIVNSYSPWRKIHVESKRYRMAVDILDLMVERQLLTRDSRGNILYCTVEN